MCWTIIDHLLDTSVIASTGKSVVVLIRRGRTAEKKCIKLLWITTRFTHFMTSGNAVSGDQLSTWDSLIRQFSCFLETHNENKYPSSFTLKFEVFLVEMSTRELLQCYNKGCGKEYKEDENGEGDYWSLIVPWIS